MPARVCPVQALTATFRAELRKFDRERALPAWDGLVTKQQAALEGWGAPAMFPTTHAPDREVSSVRHQIRKSKLCLSRCLLHPPSQHTLVEPPRPFRFPLSFLSLLPSGPAASRTEASTGFSPLLIALRCVLKSRI